MRHTATEGKVYQDTLNDLEGRILDMRRTLRMATDDHGNQETNHTFPKHSVKLEATGSEEILKELNRECHGTGYDVCPKCNRDFLPGFLEQHVQTCDGKKRDISSATGKEGEENYDGQEIDEDDEKDKVFHSTGIVIKRKSPDEQKSLKTSESLRCPFCYLFFPTTRYQNHIIDCRTLKERKGRKLTGTKRVMDAYATVPYPPTNIRVISTTSDSFALQWQPPVFDGGAEVYEYELSYCQRTKFFDKYGSLVRESVGEPCIVTTSRWCKNLPVHHTGILVRNLPARTEFVKLKVRSLNIKGYSPWSENIESVNTKAACPPTPPLHLEVTGVTFNEISLRWTEPLFTGGVPIEKYVLEYTEEKADFTNMLNTGASYSIIETVHTEISTDTRLTLKKLPYSVSFTKFRVKAVNAKGKTGPPSRPVDHIRTLDGNRGQQLVYDLQQMLQSKEHKVDVMYQGFHQRFERKRYISILKHELKKWIKEDGKIEGIDSVINLESLTESDEEGEVCENEQELIDNRETWTLTAKELKQKKTNLQRNQFRKRIGIIQKDISSLESHIEHLRAARVKLKKTAHEAEERLAELLAEQYKLDKFRGKDVDSAILHGQIQRFDKESLLDMISVEIQECRHIISQCRQKLNAGMAAETAYQETLDAKEEDVKERRSAFMKWEKSLKDESTKMQILETWRNIGLAKSFRSWKEFVETEKRNKTIMRGVLLRMIHCKLSQGFDTWLEYCRRHKEAEQKTVIGNDEFVGLGTYYLSKAQESRQGLVKDTAALLQYIDQLNEDLTLSDYRFKNNLRSTVPRSRTIELHSVTLSNKSIVSEQTQQDDSLSKLPQSVENMLSSVYDPESGSIESIRRGTELLAKKDLGLTIGEEVAVYIQLGKGYIGHGKLDEAEGCLRRAEKVLGEDEHVPGLTQVYVLLCSIYDKRENWDMAIIHYRRLLQLAGELKDLRKEAMALHGLARAYSYSAKFDMSRELLEEAIKRLIVVNDPRPLSEAYTELGHILRLTNNFKLAEVYEKKSEDLLQEDKNRIQASINSLSDLEQRILGIEILAGGIVNMEAVTPIVPLVRNRRDRIKELLSILRTLSDAAHEFSEREGKRLNALNAEYDRLINTGSRKVSSNVLHQGTHQTFDIQTLRQNLSKEIKGLEQETTEASNDYRKFDMQIQNLEDDLENSEDTLKTEFSQLSQSIQKRKAFRCIAFNEINLELNDALGDKGCGFPTMAVSVDSACILYRMEDGIADNSFLSDVVGAHRGPLAGHTRQITSMCYRDKWVITGSADTTIRLWDVKLKRIYGKIHANIRIGDEEIARPEEGQDTDLSNLKTQKQQLGHVGVLHGHRGTVCCIKATRRLIVSGGADSTVCVWDMKKLTLLRKLRGHEAQVNCVNIDDSLIVSGSVDEDVRVWKYAGSNQDPFSEVELLHRLRGHFCSVTAIAISEKQVCSGDQEGKIIMWSLRKGEIRKSSKIHEGRITALQIDSTRIVSASTDNSVIISDAVTGRRLNAILQRLTSPVISIQYDTDRLLCGSADRRLHIFYWKGRSKDKLVRTHLMEPSDTVTKLADQYQVSTEDLLSWNQCATMKDFYTGMRVIVRPPPVRGTEGENED